MAEVYSLYLMELLMQSNNNLPVEVAWHYFMLRFPQLWTNYSDFVNFILSQSILFCIQGNMVCLKSQQHNESLGFIVQPEFSGQPSHVSGSQPIYAIQIDNLLSETEAVKYFQKQLNKRMEKWVQIKSLAGHLSQASPEIRRIVGSQSEFIYFLQRHPFIFEIQGDLVSLRDELKSNYFTQNEQNSVFSLSKSIRKTRPMSMHFPSSNQTHQVGSGVSDYLNIHQSTQRITQLPMNIDLCNTIHRKNSSQTVLITLMDYLAVMWLRQTILNLCLGSLTKSTSLNSLTKALVDAPESIRNIIGLTQIEITEFLKKYEQIFDLNELNCKARFIRASSLTFVITDCNSTNNHSISLVNKKGIVFCISTSWGIIDLGQHEHVFFDRSLFKNVADLTRHFVVGETLCFNAVLAPKESRAKWRATQVWKENDNLASQIYGLQSEKTMLDMSEASKSSADSDSGVQENNSLHHAVNLHTLSKDKTSHSSLRDLRTLLSEVGVKANSEVTLPFNVIQLNDVAGSNYPGKMRIESLELLGEDVDVECEELEEDMEERNPLQKPSAYHHDSDGSISDLNTMSDIPSISAMADNSSFHLPVSSTKKYPEVGSMVNAGTQTYFTGDIMAKKVYHDHTD